MMKRALPFLILVLLLSLAATPTMAQASVVRAVLFFLPTCGHCAQVINNELPWIFDAFGGQPEIYYDNTLAEEDLTFYLLTNGQLELFLIDASRAAGAELYLAATESHGIPEEDAGVPRLIVGETYLVGAADIPQQFPGLIEVGLAAEGINWPTIPGLSEALASVPIPEPFLSPVERTETPKPVETAQPTSTIPSPTESAFLELPDPTEIPIADLIPVESTSVIDRFRNDLVGNSLSVIVLIGMLFAVGSVVVRFGQTNPEVALNPWIPILALIGVGVAAYLTFVETTGSEAVCGPVGDCNSVQQSRYARLFGFLPVGLLGLVSYLILLVSWGIGRMKLGAASQWAKIAIFALSAVGTLFSIYLTFLEPFVIGATCAWCLTSAVIITLIFWLSQNAAKTAWARVGTQST